MDNIGKSWIEIAEPGAFRATLIDQDLDKIRAIVREEIASHEKLYEDIKVYHAALDELLSLFVFHVGWDYATVNDALKVLARHRELPLTVAIAERIEQLKEGKS